MARITVLATGGTIASTRSSTPGATATESIEALLQSVDTGAHEVTGKDILTTGSYLLNHKDLRIIAESVADVLNDDDCDGVVLTHGTDTLEETAYLLDLVHSSSKPVVVTGAQRTPDSIGHDGELNLQDAIAVAGSLKSQERGVLIVFAGAIHPARGTTKLHTTNPSPFGGVGACGYVADIPSSASEIGESSTHADKQVHYHACPRRARALNLPDERFDSTRVDVVATHPGADATAASICGCWSHRTSSCGYRCRQRKPHTVGVDFRGNRIRHYRWVIHSRSTRIGTSPVWKRWCFRFSASWCALHGRSPMVPSKNPSCIVVVSAASHFIRCLS